MLTYQSLRIMIPRRCGCTFDGGGGRGGGVPGLENELNNLQEYHSVDSHKQ